jgi:hypothetical protein
MNEQGHTYHSLSSFRLRLDILCQPLKTPDISHDASVIKKEGTKSKTIFNGTTLVLVKYNCFSAI